MVQKSLIIFILLCSVFSVAQKKPAQQKKYQDQNLPTLTWDLGASMGSYAGLSYTQLDVGLNWRFAEMLNWRNTVFNRFGSTTQLSGLDSSLRFEYLGQSEGGGLGYRLFAGPGVRISSAAYTGYFAEAGAMLRFGGLNIGGGVKALQYTSPGRDSTGQLMSSSDVTYFIVLSGGGVL